MNKYKTSGILLVLIFLYSYTWAQRANYLAVYRHYSKLSDSFYNVHQYKFAGIYTDSAIAQYPNKYSYYNAACCWAMAGDIKHAANQLQHAIDSEYFDLEGMNKDKDLQPLRSDLRLWDSISLYLKNALAVYELHYDTALRNKLKYIKHLDQQYRYNIDTFRIYRAKQWVLDSMNQIIISKLIDYKGYPGKSLVGHDLENVAFLVIQHAPLAMQLKYYDILTAAADSGELLPSSVALLVDRVKISTGKKQVYGTQLDMDNQGKYKVSPIEDEKNVDMRRAKVGLGSLRNYLKTWDIDYHPLR